MSGKNVVNVVVHSFVANSSLLACCNLVVFFPPYVFLLFLEVSCEKGFSPFLILIFALGAKVSKCISESFGRSGSVLVELARTEVSSEETVPFIYQGSTQRKPGDA